MAIVMTDQIRHPAEKAMLSDRHTAAGGQPFEMNGKQDDEYNTEEELRQRYTEYADGCAEIIHNCILHKRRKETEDQSNHGSKQQAIERQFNGVWQSTRQHGADILPRRRGIAKIPMEYLIQPAKVPDNGRIVQAQGLTRRILLRF